jgi:hypothetical protein
MAKNYSKENDFSRLIKNSFTAFIGALSLDTELNEKIYKSFITLLPYLLK